MENPERTIDRMAARQHGVVTRTQLLAADIDGAVIDRRIRRGRLHPIHRGVYMVGPVAAPRAPEMAAVLACGSASALSHLSAATVLWQMLAHRRRPERPEVMDRNRLHRRPGIRTRFVRTLRPDETTTLDGIPVTTPARTLHDLAAVVGPRELERALAEALAKRLTTLDAVARVVARHPRDPGRATLRALLQDGRPALTRSEAEERFLALIREAGLPMPAANVRVEGLEVDFLWRAERLVVEVDGYAFHSSPGAFNNDRRRDTALVAAGLRVTRLTWQQITEEPMPVVARLAQALARAPRR
jgi:very-short-patch-repair endonuclease